MRIHIFLAVLLLAPVLALAESDLVRKPSPHGVKETIDRLEMVVREKGLTVFARIDHGANAESAGKELPESQVLIFGDPAAGSRVMIHDLAVGLDLPLRVLVYKDFGGNTWLVYHNPQGLKSDFGVEECKILDQMEKGLDMMTGAAVQ